MSRLDFGPGKIWWLSSRLHHAGHPTSARLLKAINFVLFKAVLPPECSMASPVTLYHRGVGVVVHPTVTFGHDVRIAQHATITTSDWQATEPRVHVGDGVTVGMGAVINGKLGVLTQIGSGAKIGANAVVVGQVPEGATVVAPLGIVLTPVD